MDVVEFIEGLNLFDILVVFFVAAFFVVGYIQGTLRRALGLAIALVSLLLALNLRDPLGAWLAQYWTQLPQAYVVHARARRELPRDLRPRLHHGPDLLPEDGRVLEGDGGGRGSRRDPGRGPGPPARERAHHDPGLVLRPIGRPARARTSWGSWATSTRSTTRPTSSSSSASSLIPLFFALFGWIVPPDLAEMYR